MSEWSDWTLHDGKGCPLPNGVWVQVEGERPDGALGCYEGPCDAAGGEWDWRYFGTVGQDQTGRRVIGGRILRYRTRIYRAGLDLIASVTNPVREDA